MKVAVYCSAKDVIPEEYLQLGDAVGTWLAQHGHTLVYGGATGGLMTRISNAVRTAGGYVIGVLILENDPLNTDEFVGNGSLKTFTLSDPPLRMVEVSINGTATTDYTVVADEISFQTAPAEGAAIKVQYEPSIPNYDYTVVRVAVSLNHTVLAIKRVEK